MAIEAVAATDALRVVVIGAGAVGSFLGGMLAASGHDVTLLTRRPYEGPDADRLVLDGPDGDRVVVQVRRASDASTIRDADLVLVAVKSFDLPGALAVAAPWPGIPLMTVQNGVGAEEEAAAARTSPILAGSLTTAVEQAPGGVHRRRTGGMGVSVVRGDAAVHGLAGRLAEAWTAAGLPARVYPTPGR